MLLWVHSIYHDWYTGQINQFRVPGGTKPYVVDAEHVLALTGNIADWSRAVNSVEQLNQKIEQPLCCKVFVLSRGLMEHGKKFVYDHLHHKLELYIQRFLFNQNMSVGKAIYNSDNFESILGQRSSRGVIIFRHIAKAS
jgi:hypothetical protein